MAIERLSFGTAANNDGEFIRTAFPKLDSNDAYLEGLISAHETRIDNLETDVAAGVPAGTSGYALIGNGVGNATTFQGFTQAGTGAVTRTWLSKLRETCVTPQDFGALADNATDDSSAFQKAIDSGNAVYVPPGTYYLGNTALSISNKAFLLFGSGIGVSNLRWNGSAGGISASQNNDDYHTEVRDLSLLQSGTGVGTALAYDGSGQKSGGVIQNRTSPRLLIENVSIRGATAVNTNGWSVHVSCNNAMHARAVGVHMEGYYTSLPTLLSTRGMYFYGDGSPVEIVISECWALGVPVAVEAVDCEGVFVHNCDFVAVTTGVLFNPSGVEPQLNVTDSHINAFSYGIDANNLAQGQISNNLMYSRNDASGAVTHIRLASGCQKSHISDNTFIKTSSTANTAIDIGSGASNCPNNVIRDNIFDTVDTAVNLGASANTTKIFSNVYTSGGTTQLVDGGTSTSRRFDDHLGTAALPSWSWTGDPDTGMYLVSANKLGWATGGVSRYTLDGSGLLEGSAAGTPLRLVNTTDSAANIALIIESDRATPTANDRVGASFKLSNDAGTQTEFGRIEALGSVLTAASESAQLRFYVVSGGALSAELALSATSLFPVTSDGLALGSSTNGWSDADFALGAVLRFNNADTITHSAGLFTFSTPLSLGVANALTAGSIELGHASDTTIGRTSAGLINVEGVDLVTISASQTLTTKTFDLTDNTLTGTKAEFDTACSDDNFAYLATAQTFTAAQAISVAGIPATLTNTSNSASVQVIRLDGDRSAPAGSDTAYQSMYMSNGSGTQTEIARQSWIIPAITAGAENGRLFWSVIGGGTLADRMTLNSAALYCSTSDGLTLGTSANMWSDLFLASGALINWNNGTLTLTQSGTTLDLLGTMQMDTLRIDQAASSIGTGAKVISNAADSSTNFGKYFSINLNGTTVYVPCSTVAPT